MSVAVDTVMGALHLETIGLNRVEKRPTMVRQTWAPSWNRSEEKMALVGKYLAIVLALAATNCGIATADHPSSSTRQGNGDVDCPGQSAFSSCAGLMWRQATGSTKPHLPSV